MLASNALTTVEEAKRFLGLEDDNGIERAINEASAMIETYCRRSFAKSEHTEYLNKCDMLEYYPVLELKTLNSKPFTSHHSSRFNYKSGIFYCEVTGEVEYEAGYVLPKDETPDNPRTLPYDLERACLQLIDTLFVDGDGYISDVDTLRLGDWSINTKGATSAIEGLIPDTARATLDMYRRALL